MRIKLSKQDWRLAGQKMGWLKRAKVAGDSAGAMKEELVGNQKKLDVNKNNRLDAEDFSMLRAKGKRKAKRKDKG